MLLACTRIRLLRSIGCLLFLCALLAAARSPAAPANPPITIGIALSFSGPLANEGQYMKKGYDLWAERVNAKGGIEVGGGRRPVKLIYYDDQSDATTVAKLVERLITEDKADFIFGPYGSGLTGAASSISEKYQKLMIAPAANADQLYTRGYKFFFGVLPPLSQGFALHANLLANLTPKVKTVAIAYPGDLFPSAAAAAAEKRAKEEGLQVVYSGKYPKGAKDLSAVITQVKALNPDALLSPGYFEDITLLVTQSQRLGFNPGYIGVQLAPGLTKSLGKNADYLFATSWWEPLAGWKDDYFGTSAEYNDLFKKTYGVDANYFATCASAAGELLDLAIRKVGSLDPAKIAEVLHATKMETFFGPVEYDQTGANRKGTGLVVQIQDGREVIVWPKTTSTKPARFPAPPWDKR
jgi:branched-chain amino acid transport system substrate-binding protein